MAEARRLTSFRNGDLQFDVVDSGPIDGETVVLLHGFPQTSTSWGRVWPMLNELGYRTVAPDQRGYSPGARPAGRRAYRLPKIVDDTMALVDALDARRVHLVGHDWGAAVAWWMAAEHPERVRTLTALSVPHPEAFLRSLVSSTQLFRSFYMFVFQLPWLPEQLFRMSRVAVHSLRAMGQSKENAERDVRQLLSSGALTGALNWYRALPLTKPGDKRKVPVPTLFLWSDRDTAVARKGAELTADYVSGSYEFHILAGVSHWIPDEVPETLAELIGKHARNNAS